MAIQALPVDQRIIDIDSRRFASVEKALVELVTNVDDSYSRLEQTGATPEGLVTIGYERHRNGAVLSVADRAEGMGLERIRAVLSYGGAHSQLSRGQTGGRGYFGRGLKQAIYGLGHGWIESIRAGRYARVDLFRAEDGSYVYDDWDGDFPAGRADHSLLDIPYGAEGTRVTIVVDNPDVVVPRFSTLAAALSDNIYLRDLLGRRTVRLASGVGDDRAEPVRLVHEEPESEVLVGPGAVASFSFGGAGYDYQLTLRRTLAEELETRGDERTNGLLVLSGAAVLDCQFFRYENQLGTEHLFGTVSCPALAARLAAGHPVISDERAGLNLREPFVAAFAEAVSDAIAPVVQSERLRLSHVDRASTSRRTTALVEQVLARMSQAAVEDLGIVVPPVLHFSTPFYYRTVGHPFHVMLDVDRNRTEGQHTVTFGYELPSSITVEPRPATVQVADLEAGRFRFTVSGAVVGDRGRITAVCGPWQAACEVVIAEHGSGHGLGRPGRPSRTPTTWDRDPSTALFAGYQLRNLHNDVDRAVYSPDERLVLVNTEAPTVRLYIDGRGRFRDGARLLLAELLLDAITDELARRAVARTGHADDAHVLREAKDAYVQRYGLEVHRIMLGEDAGSFRPAEGAAAGTG